MPPPSDAPRATDVRLSGNPDGCLDVVRVLERCSASVQSAQERPESPLLSLAPWTGTASDLWGGHLLRGAADVDETAAQVQAAARALRTFGHGLAELQTRARQLTDEAAAARLVLDDAGRIAPVPLSVDPDLQSEQLRRTAVRTALLHGVHAVLAEQDALHTALIRALGQEVVQLAETWSWTSPWRPGIADTSAALLAGSKAGLHAVADEGLRLVGRAAGSTGMGAAVTATGELAAGQDPVDVALTTAVVTAGASSGGALAMAGMAGVALLAAPVAVPAGIGVAAVAVGGLVGGYVADRLWDAHGQDVKRAGGRLLSSARLPWVDRPSDGRRRRR